MIPPNSSVYLETSAINFLADKYSFQDARATHAYHLLKGTRFYISNVSIWEILLTKDIERREKIIQYIQNIGYPKLIHSPSELIIRYIKNGMPINEKKCNLHSILPLASTWEDICRNRDKTFVFDQEDLKVRSKMIQELFKLANKEITSTPLIISSENETTELQRLVSKKIQQLKTIKYREQPTDNKIKLKLSLLLILIILCNETTLDNQPIKDFWSEIGINNTFERLDYTIKNMESLITEGPFIVLAEMTYVQLKEGGKPTRGIFWDVLHSIYLIYSNMFFTNDNHFNKLKLENNHLIYNRIINMEEAKWFTAKRI